MDLHSKHYRNWDASFDTKDGVSNNPCTDIYPGAKPWDQPCVDSVQTFLADLKESVKSSHNFLLTVNLLFTFDAVQLTYFQVLESHHLLS